MHPIFEKKKKENVLVNVSEKIVTSWSYKKMRSNGIKFVVKQLSNVGYTNDKV